MISIMAYKPYITTEPIESNTQIITQQQHILTQSKSNYIEFTSNCIESYPDFCIIQSSFAINCHDLVVSDFTVQGNDPYNFDRDSNGVGCELAQIKSKHAELDDMSDCLRSYTDFCMSPGLSDLDCFDIQFSNFAVRGNDPYNFDRDNNGIGCESVTVKSKATKPAQDKPKDTKPAPVKSKHTEPNIPDCLDSYPDFCILSGTPDLDCSDIQYSDFTVRGSDPHRFDRDNNGIGCDSETVKPKDPEPNPVKSKRTESNTVNCLSSYPDFCIPPGPPDLNCSDIRQSDFTVRGSDPHGFDRDNDGVGCES